MNQSNHSTESKSDSVSYAASLNATENTIPVSSKNDSGDIQSAKANPEISNEAMEILSGINLDDMNGSTNANGEQTSRKPKAKERNPADHASNDRGGETPRKKLVATASNKPVDDAVRPAHEATSDVEPSAESIEAHEESAEIEEATGTRFSDLGLSAEICSSLEQAGYITPTPIQAATIPYLLEGKDVLGQAQTGTGKTAAFALPLLNRIDTSKRAPQILVLAPTRELAMQVAESFERYASHLPDLQVVCLYGGSGYSPQIQALRRGPQVVVGTPGRVMDHMREERLQLDQLSCLVLDEADEMLRMGFVEDVRWVLSQAPEHIQIALFSATMPSAIREIADQYLKAPHVVSIDGKQRTAETIRQRYVYVQPKFKFRALERLLESEETDATIIFVKTRNATVEVAEALNKKGFRAVAINGDIAQAQRERAIEQLKDGIFDILVATDVAARGLDVPRVTHVINFDLPFDTEAYIHRIGRTGRAGRDGQAILFLTPRQRGFLRDVQRTVGKPIEETFVPTVRELNASRIAKFKSKIVERCNKPADVALSEQFNKWIAECVQENGLEISQVATALASLASGDRPFLLNEEDIPNEFTRGRNERDGRDRDGRGRDDRFGRNGGRGGYGGDRFQDAGRQDGGRSRTPRFDPRDRPAGSKEDGKTGMEQFRLEVGRAHGVRPGHIVGAIANEIELNSNYIGQITIYDEHSTVFLPSGMPRELFKILGRAWVVGRQLRISKLSDRGRGRSRPRAFEARD